MAFGQTKVWIWGHIITFIKYKYEEHWPFDYKALSGISELESLSNNVFCFRSGMLPMQHNGQQQCREVVGQVGYMGKKWKISKIMYMGDFRNSLCCTLLLKEIGSVIYLWNNLLWLSWLIFSFIKCFLMHLPEAHLVVPVPCRNVFIVKTLLDVV